MGCRAVPPLRARLGPRRRSTARRSGRRGIALALAVATTGLLLVVRSEIAWAHPRSQAPAPTPAPTPTPRPATAEPQTHDDALRAAAGLAREVATLVALGAFEPDSSSQLATAVLPAAPAAGSTRDQLITGLQVIQSQEPFLAAALSTDGVRLDPDVALALTPLGPADEEALAAGRPISLPADLYLHALDRLLNDEGWPPSGPTSQPDPSKIAAALPAALDLAATSTGPSPTASPTAQTSPSPTAQTTPSASTAQTVSVVPAGAAATHQPTWIDAVRPALPWIVVALAGLLGLQLLLRRGGGGRATAATTRVEDLLEISRRLDAEDTSASIDRAVIREVTRVIPAPSAAVVARRDGRWIVAEETDPGLLAAESLRDGVIGRVADTGQLAVTVSATEPALGGPPVALAAIPLAAAGVVSSVLVLIRPAWQPFTNAERDVMLAAGPAVAAAVERARRARTLLRESLLDPLTGAGNRRGFDSALAGVLEAGNHASLIIIDLDHFKRVNDTHGHPAGDALLRGVVEVVRRTAAPHDGVYRYGGEEFCILLPDTPLADAQLVAERVRRGVEEHDFAVGVGLRLRATASLGVAAANGDGAQGLVARADAALYGAKTSGRNRVCAG